MSTSFFRASLADVGFQNFFPLALRLKDEFDGVAESAVATGIGRNVVRFLLYFGAGIFHSDGEACGAHGGKVDDVVADEGGFVQSDSFFFDDCLKARAFVLDSLTNIFEFQIAGAKGDSFRDALGDESGLDAAETRERDRGAVVGVKAFGFDQTLC
jgi:hypothetical protein